MVKMKSQNNKFAALIQFIKFGLVGALNTVLNYLIYNFCYYVFNSGVHIANFVGFVITVFIAYILQSRFVFKQNESGEKRIWWKVLIKTYVSYSFTGLFLTELLLLLWINVINIGQYLGEASEWLSNFEITIDQYDLAASLAPLLNMLITIPTNFLINKFWAYRQKTVCTDSGINDDTNEHSSNKEA